MFPFRYSQSRNRHNTFASIRYKPLHWPSECAVDNDINSELFLYLMKLKILAGGQHTSKQL